MLNYKLLRNIGIGLACVAVPAAVVGGYFGMSKANPYYIYYRTPITGDPNGFISAYLSAQYLGAQVIVAPGFTHKEPIVQLYKQYPKETKDLGFLLLDESIGLGPNNSLEAGATNTWSINFRTDLGSIRTAIALCMFLNQNVDVFKTSDQDKLTFGMYGGMPFNSVTSFMGGMEAGIKWFNETLAGKPNPYEQSKKLEQIEIVTPVDNNFSGGFGPGDGDSIINSYLQLTDIDALMPVAGPQIWSAQKKIQELNKKTILIGVDSPCENDAQNKELNFTNNGKTIGNGKYVQFSSEKNLSVAVDKALQLINNGNKLPLGSQQSDFSEFVDSNGVGGFGTTAIGNIQNKCVGVSTAGQSYFDKAIELGGSDPSQDAKYDESINMVYTYKDKTYKYDDLRKKFINSVAEYNKLNNASVSPLSLKDFIKKGRKEDANKIKVVLSTPTSVLFDGSFSESAYLGMCNYYDSMGIYIPKKGNK